MDSNINEEKDEFYSNEMYGGYNISKYIRMAWSEIFEFDNGDLFASWTLPKCIKYIVESHAKLKEESDHLKAEIERLKDANECIDQMHDKEIARSDFLCKKVERLTKAGDVMATMLQFDEVAKDWNAAKEGKDI